MAKTLTRGCTFDNQTKMWAVWMNKPNGLTISDRPLYHNLCDCYVKNVTNRKGIPMLVCGGKLPPTVRDLNGFLIQMRADFTAYINKKKREAGL